MKKKIAVLLALVALAGFAAASTLTVKQRQENATLVAERMTLAGVFSIDTTPGLAAIAMSLPPNTPVEIGPGPVYPNARTALTQDTWSYTVIVKENTPNAVTAGNYSIELQLDGASLGSILVNQANPDSNATEGVIATFGLGATIGTSSLYFVSVKPYVQLLPTVEYVVESKAATGSLPLRWQGVSPSNISGATNPTLTAAFGAPIRLVAKNGDGEGHNIGFIGTAGSNTPIGPGWSGQINNIGQEAQITWTPSAPGSYYYRCQYHSSMAGEVDIT